MKLSLRDNCITLGSISLWLKRGGREESPCKLSWERLVDGRWYREPGGGGISRAIIQRVEPHSESPGLRDRVKSSLQHWRYGGGTSLMSFPWEPPFRLFTSFSFRFQLRTINLAWVSPWVKSPSFLLWKYQLSAFSFDAPSWVHLRCVLMLDSCGMT